MPATAGRVRMPANNRVHSSAALQTHGIWQSTIGYDPYAPNKDESKKSDPKSADPDNPYTNFRGLLDLARMSGSSADVARGACNKCGRVGHLTFQCRNFLSVKEEISKVKDDEDGGIAADLEKWKGSRDKKAKVESEPSSEEEESESSDSEYDSEIERAIAERYGNKSKVSKRRGRSKRRRGHGVSEDESEEEDKSHRKTRKEKRRRRDDDSSDKEQHSKKRKDRKEKRRRRSHRHPEDSDESSDDSPPPRHKRRGRRHATSSDSDDLRVGRDRNRSEKRSRKRHHYDED